MEYTLENTDPEMNENTIEETHVVEEPTIEEPIIEEPVLEETPVVEEPVVVSEEPAVEEPAVEEPAVEEPAVEEPAVEEPVVEETVVEETVVVSEEPVAEEPVIEEHVVVSEEPVIEEPVVVSEEPVVEEPVVEEPVIEEPVFVSEEPVVVSEEPVVEEPVIEEPVVVSEEPVVEEPVVEEPVVEEPVVEEPVVEEPVVEEPVVEEPVVVSDEPAVEKLVVEEPVVEEPVVEEPVIEEPVLEETPVADEPVFTVPRIVFIVPYRDRESQLKDFDQHMRTIILKDKPQGYYEIYYIHQMDKRVFNRGALKNIGFLFVKNKYPQDYKNITLVFNDVDTLPINVTTIPNYETVSGVVKHFYGFPNALGGIFSMNASNFELINGFPNYWSWGYEDNELYNRSQNVRMIVDRSVFYKINDQENIKQSQNGRIRVVNKAEFDRYARKVPEGIRSITNIRCNLNEDNQSFVNVLYFETGIEHDKVNDMLYDISKGNQPFFTGFSTRRRSSMNMFM
jgi:N-terminal region of glycosyl transferase group 7/N-terminal domain of galactosyltransferase